MIVNFIKRIYWFVKYKLAKYNARNDNFSRLSQGDLEKILILCYGNIYRSPFVAEYLSDKLKSFGRYEIRSAGFFPVENRKSSNSYISLVSGYGIDLRDHRSTLVDDSMIQWADIIIIMDGKNYKLLLLKNKFVKNKIIWLGAINRKDSVEIPDPYGQSIEKQNEIVTQMTKSCDGLLNNYFIK